MVGYGEAGMHQALGEGLRRVRLGHASGTRHVIPTSSSAGIVVDSQSIRTTQEEEEEEVVVVAQKKSGATTTRGQEEALKGRSKRVTCW